MSAPATDARLPFGAILAGGASRRFGSPKALATVGGRRIVDSVLAAIRQVVPDPVLITNRPALFADLGVPARGDEIPGGGAMSGLHSALRAARRAGRAGALCVACDTPFLSPGLLRRIVEVAATTDPQAVAPESLAEHGLEPLCAWYSISALPEVETRLARGELSLSALLHALRVEPVPLAVVRGYGDPAEIFLNVNTPADHRTAELVANRAARSHAAS